MLLKRVVIPAGKDAVFYIDGKIVQRASYAVETSVFIEFEYFVGSKSQVDAHIESLSLL